MCERDRERERAIGGQSERGKEKGKERAKRKRLERECVREGGRKRVREIAIGKITNRANYLSFYAILLSNLVFYASIGIRIAAIQSTE